MKSTSNDFGLIAMGAFLLFAATMATLAGFTLLFPGTILDPVWKLNPVASEQLHQLGPVVAIAFIALAVVMLVVAIGWMKRRFWSWALAVVIIASQVVGALGNAIRGQYLQGAIGVLIAGVLLIYLLQPKVRTAFPRSRN